MRALIKNKNKMGNDASRNPRARGCRQEFLAEIKNKEMAQSYLPAVQAQEARATQRVVAVPSLAAAAAAAAEEALAVLFQGFVLLKNLHRERERDIEIARE
jgi:Flp pilus assembly secretin CpaC